MARRCVFCGERRLSVEDALPLWISRLLLAPSDRVAVRVFERVGNELPAPRFFRDSKQADVRVKQVCSPCNNGWMSRLEDAVQPWLTPMLLGEPVELSAEVQRLVARWAVKTATMFHYNYPSRAAIPAARLKHLRTDDNPPVDAHVWLAASDGKIQPAEYMIGSMDLKTSGLPDTDGEAFTLCVGQLAIQVFTVTLTEHPRTMRFRTDDRILQIWPNDGSTIHWPPPSFDDSQLEALHMRFITTNEPFPFTRR